MPELMVDFITSRVLTGPPDPARADRGRGRDVRLASGPCRVACAPADVSAGRSATAFAVTLWPVEAFELSGEMSSYDGRGFCPRCGSRLLNPADPGDTLVEIRIGSLDEAPFELKPEREIWVKRRESWLPPVEGAAQYDES
jgi:hypothetical protein